MTPQLRHWIIKQIESGQSPESVLKSLVGNGWPEGAALEVMQRTLRARVAQIRARENTAQSQGQAQSQISGDGPAE